MLRIRTIRRALPALALVAVTMTLGVTGVHAQTPPSEPYFVETSIDNSRPYLGQQITYVFKGYLRSDLSLSSDQLDQLQYDPDPSGFWTYQETERHDYNETVGSNHYRVVELRSALFPSVVGTVEIGVSTLTVPTSSSQAPIILEGAPAIIDVLPLPPGAPAGFTGAVGSFDISVGVDSGSGKVNEPVQLTVRVLGEGNIETLPEPAWPSFADWRVVEWPVAADSQVVDGRIRGIRTYSIAMVPTKGGQLTIPEIEYIHFDPNLKRYVVASTAPIAVSVSEGDDLSPPPQSIDAGAVAEEEDSEARYVKAVPSSLRHSGGELTDSAIYWAAWGIPALAILGAVAWRRRRHAIEAALSTSRQRNALPNARALLARAAASGDDPRVASADAVLSYISDRLGASLGRVTHEDLGRRLLDEGVPPDLVQRVDETLAAGEAVIYTPQGSSPSVKTDQLERTDHLLTDLDGVMES